MAAFDHGTGADFPSSIREALRSLIGTTVTVATEGGNTWTGPVGAVVGNLLVLGGETIRYVDITDVTALDVVGANGNGNGNGNGTAGRNNGTIVTGGTVVR